MQAEDIGLHRLVSQHIAHPTFERPDQVVSWLGAVQAQDYAGAQWSIGLRLPDATDADIERAVADKTIVRTWPMRGTLHFVAAKDVRWMVELLTPRIVAGAAARRRQLELDDAVLAHSREVLIAALQGGNCLPREALYLVFEEAQISTARQRGLHILWELAHEGLICFGPRQGKQYTFALLDEWLPGAKRLNRDEALAEMALRYFTSHGPATVQDFMWWTGLTARDARFGLEAVKDQLVREDVDGRSYWMSASGLEVQGRQPPVHLLPGFDEYLLGYRDRSAVLDSTSRGHVVPGDNGVFNPTIVIDGRIAGTWKRSVSKGAMNIAYSPFAPLRDVQTRAIAVAAERYARFLGTSVAET
jgi:hypothetical protein